MNKKELLYGNNNDLSFEGKYTNKLTVDTINYSQYGYTRNMGSIDPQYIDNKDGIELYRVRLLHSTDLLLTFGGNITNSDISHLYFGFYQENFKAELEYSSSGIWQIIIDYNIFAKYYGQTVYIWLASTPAPF